MNRQEIETINEGLYVFVKKLLMGNITNAEINAEVSDVIQNSWMKFLAKYPHLQEVFIEARALLYRIAKNEALQVLLEKAKMVSESNFPEGKARTPSNFYDAFMKEDLKRFLELLPPTQAFIFEMAAQFEDTHKQVQVVAIIQSEYQKRFNSVLTLDNYRQLKSRGRENLLKFLRNERI
ncbi:MAG: hypothetical protein HC913_23145 [Microscillaceae bacterium]|nr:hypothetical protein [Microscillaceae bacterium]